MSDPVITTPGRRLELAYLSVFGDPAKRTTDQQLVMRDLESHCFAYRLVSEARGPQDGELAVQRAIFNDGRRSVWLRVRGLVIKAMIEPKVRKISRKPTSNP